MGFLGIAGIVAVATLRYFGGREELAKRVFGQKRLQNQFKSFRHELTTALDDSNPAKVLDAIVDVQRKISGFVNTAIQEEIWPYSPVAPSAKQRAKEEAAKILNDLNSEWSNVEVEESTVDDLPEQRVAVRQKVQRSKLSLC
jgi:hypothetical protein